MPLLQITGAGHGIGRELALQLSRVGAEVICCDINEVRQKTGLALKKMWLEKKKIETK